MGKHRAFVNRMGIVLLHNNAWQNVAELTLKKIHDLRWEVLTHPPYSPDLAPSDFHLFPTLQNFIKEKTYAKVGDIKTDISSFFASQTSMKLALGQLFQVVDYSDE